MRYEDTPKAQCAAIIGQEPSAFGFRGIRCGQVVAIRTYMTTLGFRVGFCPNTGHQANVRRRYEAVPFPEDEPRGLDELMAFR